MPLLEINYLRFLSCKKGFELHGKNNVKKGDFLVFFFVFVDNSVDKCLNLLKNHCFMSLWITHFITLLRCKKWEINIFINQ